MEFITQWLANIILFILLAIVIDLLIPNTALQRYVKMVVGLLLIVIILTPLFTIFNKDLQEILSQVTIAEITADEKIKNSIESKKREIQASQRAYILEEVAVHMKSQVEKELLRLYNYEIYDLALFVEADSDSFTMEDLSKVVVTIGARKEKIPQVEQVSKVVVDLSQPSEHSKTNEKELTEIQLFVAKHWEVSPELIDVVWEEG